MLTQVSAPSCNLHQTIWTRTTILWTKQPLNKGKIIAAFLTYFIHKLTLLIQVSCLYLKITLPIFTPCAAQLASLVYCLGNGLSDKFGVIRSFKHTRQFLYCYLLYHNLEKSVGKLLRLHTVHILMIVCCGLWIFLLPRRIFLQVNIFL